MGTLIHFVAILVAMLALAAPAGADTPQAVPDLAWVDKDTGKVLFTAQDIVRFDWERQRFELKPHWTTELAPLGVRGRPFLVRDHRGTIYEGVLQSGLSSIGYDGPSILTGTHGLSGALQPPLYAIQGGYPCGGDARDQDRFAPRLHAALKQAAVLGEIVTPEVVPSLRIPSTPREPWTRLGQNWSVRTTLHPWVLPIGGVATAQVEVASKAGHSRDYESLVIEATLMGGGGDTLWRGEVASIDLAAPAPDSDGTKPNGIPPRGTTLPPGEAPTLTRDCQFTLWGQTGGNRPAVKPGPVRLSLRVTAKKVMPDGKVTVQACDLPDRQLTVFEENLWCGKTDTPSR